MQADIGYVFLRSEYFLAAERLKIAIDEAYGGVGAGPVELERVMEETGATLLCSPLLSSVLAGALVQAVGDEGTKSRLLPSIADGSKVATVALTGTGLQPGELRLEIGFGDLVRRSAHRGSSRRSRHHRPRKCRARWRDSSTGSSAHLLEEQNRYQR